MSARQYEAELTRAGLNREQVSIVVHNLDAIIAAGFSQEEVSIVVHNLVADEAFRAAFLADFKNALLNMEGFKNFKNYENFKNIRGWFYRFFLFFFT